MILDTDFESYRLSVHYGKYKIQISVVFTQIDDDEFEELNDAKGNFGIISYLNFEKKSFAVKSLEISELSNDTCLYEIYQEYFLCFLADVLGAGPQVTPLFGYDIFVTKHRAYFAMEKCLPIRSN